MKENWNIHSIWIIGSLLAILVVVLSADWASIKDLASIISFAVGLSSLILAVIAIFQTLSSSGSLENSLVAVREATASSATASADLRASSEVIYEAAQAAKEASDAAQASMAELTSASTRMLESNELNRVAIADLQKEISSKSSNDAPQNASIESQEHFKFKNISMGGAAVLLAVALSFKLSKPFSLKDVLTNEDSVTFEQGYLISLRDLGFSSFDEDDNDNISIKSIAVDADKLAARARRTVFERPATQKRNIERLALVEKFFEAVE